MTKPARVVMPAGKGKQKKRRRLIPLDEIIESMEEIASGVEVAYRDASRILQYGGRSILSIPHDSAGTPACRVRSAQAVLRSSLMALQS